MILLLLFFLFVPSSAWATWHLYITPYTFNDTLKEYRPDFTGSTVPKWFAFRYGGQAYALISADVDDATDTALQADPNIKKIPDNLDQQVGSGAPLTTVRNLLETRLIPGTWVTATTTYRTIIRVVVGQCTMLLVYRRISGNYGPIMAAGLTLDTTFGSLSQKAKDDLIATAQTLGLSTAGITGSSTMREMLVIVGQQYAARPFTLGGITI